MKKSTIIKFVLTSGLFLALAIGGAGYASAACPSNGFQGNANFNQGFGSQQPFGFNAFNGSQFSNPYAGRLNCANCQNCANCPNCPQCANNMMPMQSSGCNRGTMSPFFGGSNSCQGSGCQNSGSQFSGCGGGQPCGLGF